MKDSDYQRHWYASLAAAKRDDKRREARSPRIGWAARTERMFGDRWWVLVLWDQRTSEKFRVPIAHLSIEQVDRLARDWIGHGVSPCRNGGRGVSGQWWEDTSRGPQWALELYERAERRAQNVVWRW